MNGRPRAVERETGDRRASGSLIPEGFARRGECLSYLSMPRPLVVTPCNKHWTACGLTPWHGAPAPTRREPAPPHTHIGPPCAYSPAVLPAAPPIRYASAWDAGNLLSIKLVTITSRSLARAFRLAPYFKKKSSCQIPPLTTPDALSRPLPFLSV